MVKVSIGIRLMLAIIVALLLGIGILVGTKCSTITKRIIIMTVYLVMCVTSIYFGNIAGYTNQMISVVVGGIAILGFVGTIIGIIITLVSKERHNKL